jgi:hypothetical protein
MSDDKFIDVLNGYGEMMQSAQNRKSILDGRDKMEDYNDVNDLLTPMDEEELDEKFMKEELYRQKKWRQYTSQRQAQIIAEEKQRFSKEMGLTNEQEVDQLINSLDPSTGEQLFRQSVRDHFHRMIATAKGKGQPARSGRPAPRRVDKVKLEDARKNRDADKILEALLDDSDPIFRT